MGARSTQGLSDLQLQTVVFLILVYTNQACIYVLRTDSRLWRFAPSRWMALASCSDIVAVSLLAWFGLLMAQLAPALVLVMMGTCVLFAVLPDSLKSPLFHRFAIV